MCLLGLTSLSMDTLDSDVFDESRQFKSQTSRSNMGRKVGDTIVLPRYWLCPLIIFQVTNILYCSRLK